MLRRDLALGLVSSCLFVALLVAPSRAVAQHDGELWLSARLRLRVHSRVHVDIEQGLRLDENMSHVGRVLPELGLGVQVVDWLRVSLGYRVTWVNDNNPDVRHRVHADLRFRDRLGALVWVMRARYQATLRDGEPTRHTLRGLFALGIRNESAVTPYVSTELFTDVGQGAGGTLRTWRGTAGVEIETKRHSLDVFYRLEVPLDDARDPTLHILGLSYSYEAKLY